jgi:8-oxo-dGTP diphosphatase
VPKPEPVGVARTAVRDAAATERRPDPDDPADHHAAADHHATDPHTSAITVASGDTHPGVGEIALVRDSAGRVLLVLQRSGPFAGSWLLPGGGVERIEGVSHAVARELQEETGLVVADGRVIATYQTRSEPPGEYDLMVFMYEITATGDLRPERGSKVAWFVPAEIPDPHPALRRQLFDAGVGADDDAAIDAALAGAGIRMDRLT